MSHPPVPKGTNEIEYTTGLWQTFWTGACLAGRAWRGLFEIGRGDNDGFVKRERQHAARRVASFARTNPRRTKATPGGHKVCCCCRCCCCCGCCCRCCCGCCCGCCCCCCCCRKRIAAASGPLSEERMGVAFRREVGLQVARGHSFAWRSRADPRPTALCVFALLTHKKRRPGTNQTTFLCELQEWRLR